ncbi:MAG: RluA family pseudouridine synthase [Bacteroidia bacterium]
MSTEIPLYEHHHFLVDPGQQRMRIDLYVAQRLPHLSRSRIQLAAQVGLLQVHHKPVKPSYKVKPGDLIQLYLPFPPPVEITPQPIPLDIYYQDPYLWVVNKPSGMSCHPGAGIYEGTLLNALLYHIQHQLPASEKNAHRPGLVHRIDKDTTGLLVVAIEERAYFGLAKQFYDHSVERKYTALVWGDVPKDQDTIRTHIVRNPLNRKKYSATLDPTVGKHAITHYRVIERFGYATLVECILETGRTHQIRVHMSYIGHPLVGDKTYAGDRIRVGISTERSQRYAHKLLHLMPRQALHARLLGFVHPITREKLLFEAPLPQDMQQAIDWCRMGPLHAPI